MAGSLVLTNGPPKEKQKDLQPESRRRFLKKALVAGAFLVPGALAGAGTRTAEASSAKGPSAAELEDLRQRFLAQARAALQEGHPLAGSIPEHLSDALLADLGDPGGQWANKLLVTLPQATTVTEPEAPAAVPLPDENILIRMQQDLERALQKPVEQRRWIMVIDLRKCIGCSACTVACKAENKLPPGVVYRPVIEQEIGTYPHVSRRFIPRPCMQCDNPPCVPVCPVGATYQRPDGIVEIDYNVCIGCRYCMVACPYGARYFDFGDSYTRGTPQEQRYEEEPSFEYGQGWPRQRGRSPEGNVRKCQFCLHRLAVGMLPACVTTCVGAATYFGDGNDHDSLAHELTHLPNVMRLKEELGTEPKVYYLL